LRAKRAKDSLSPCIAAQRVINLNHLPQSTNVKLPLANLEYFSETETILAHFQAALIFFVLFVLRLRVAALAEQGQDKKDKNLSCPKYLL